MSIGRPVIISLALLLFSPAVAHVKAEWVQWSGNGHFYDIVADTVSSWDQAKASAAAQGGYLAVITSAEEQQFVEDLLDSRGSASGGYWIGLRETTEGVYVWDNGEILGYKHWYPGQPDNGIGQENRGQIPWVSLADTPSSRFSYRGYWNDIASVGWPPPDLPQFFDLYRAGYVLEAVPAPSTLVGLVGMGIVGGVGYFWRRRDSR